MLEVQPQSTSKAYPKLSQIIVFFYPTFIHFIASFVSQNEMKIGLQKLLEKIGLSKLTFHD